MTTWASYKDDFLPVLAGALEQNRAGNLAGQRAQRALRQPRQAIDRGIVIRLRHALAQRLDRGRQEFAVVVVHRTGDLGQLAAIRIGAQELPDRHDPADVRPADDITGMLVVVIKGPVDIVNAPRGQGDQADPPVMIDQAALGREGKQARQQRRFKHGGSPGDGVGEKERFDVSVIVAARSPECVRDHFAARINNAHVGIDQRGLGCHKAGDKR